MTSFRKSPQRICEPYSAKESIIFTADEFKQFVRNYSAKKWLKIDYDSIKKDDSFYQWVLSQKVNIPDLMKLPPSPLDFHPIARHLYDSMPEALLQTVGSVAQIKILSFIPGKDSYDNQVRQFSGKFFSFSKGNLQLFNENTGERLSTSHKDLRFPHHCTSKCYS